MKTAEEPDKFKNVVKFPSKNWTEDYLQENGRYQNNCHDCGELFIGNKHRIFCKECDIPSPRFWERLSKKEPPQDNKCAHAGCWADGEMVGFARCMVQKVIPLEKEKAQAVANYKERVRAELNKKIEQHWFDKGYEFGLRVGLIRAKYILDTTN
jgi:hypothetical protein